MGNRPVKRGSAAWKLPPVVRHSHLRYVDPAPKEEKATRHTATLLGLCFAKRKRATFLVIVPTKSLEDSS